MEVIQGERLYIRDHNDLDYNTERLYHDDEELNALDPTVGACEKPTTFSILTNEGVYIGVCAMYNYMGGQVELGIRIWDRVYWGEGYGTEVVRLLCDWAFKTTGVDTIVLKTLNTNTRAIRCYLKCGFEPYMNSVLVGHNMLWMQKSRYGSWNQES